VKVEAWSGGGDERRCTGAAEGVVGAAGYVGDLLVEQAGQVLDDLGGGLDLRVALLQLAVAQHAKVGVAPRIELARLCSSGPTPSNMSGSPFRPLITNEYLCN
jgi:hypothetical protein